jgi:hypothetical protein
MADAALFIGWGDTKAGRERHAIELFKESLAFMTRLVSEGKVASVEPFFLEPHGGDLEGFWIVRGELDELANLRVSDEFQKFAVRAQAVVNNFGVVGATTGERLNQHMSWFAEAAKDVSGA